MPHMHSISMVTAGEVVGAVNLVGSTRAAAAAAAS